MNAVESGGNQTHPWKESKTQDVGPYQIRPGYFQDGSENDKTLEGKTHADCAG